MRIIHKEDSITLDQEHYIDVILEKFNMTNCKTADTPMVAKQALSKEDGPSNEEERIEMSAVPYQEAIGSLMYLSQCTRPDITFAVNKLSRFNANPGPKHWTAVKHILRYLKGTKGHKLTYFKSFVTPDSKYAAIKG